ncbi:MAG: helix-turn-helix domain-containing protein [Nocardioides sp.]|nr:helix-turn-helix domain-containing protein [Nocardioides sp.]
MGRPREHDPEAVLDHARRLWVEGGPAGVTIRALAAESGVSNGAIYHAFGSRDGLLARVWSREAQRFLELQRAAVTAVLDDDGPVEDAVVAAALAPTAYAELDEPGARLLLTTTGDELADRDLAPPERGELRRLRRDLTGLVTDLSSRQWGRTDRAALATMRYCVVDLPGALLLAPARLTDPVAQHALELAVRGIVREPPPYLTSAEANDGVTGSDGSSAAW